jgi:hypothetical protein
VSHFMFVHYIRMSGNGAPGPSGRGSRRTNRKRTQTMGTKKLGRVAQLAIRHNDYLAEEFIDALEAGRSTNYKLGVATVHSDGSIDVKVEGRVVRAVLRGLLKGKHGFFHNPNATTAVHKDSYVVMDGEIIMAVLSGGQASRARKALGMKSGRSSSSMFNRSSEERRNAVKRAAMIAGLNTRKAAPVRRSSSARRSSEKKRKAAGGAGGKGWLSFF